MKNPFALLLLAAATAFGQIENPPTNFPLPATFDTNVTVNGNLTVKSLTTTDPVGWALDAVQTAAATNGVLTLPDAANVVRITNANAISSVTNGRLGAFYYLVNQTTNALTISNAGGITVQGGTPLTLGANQAATLVATGPTNASVAARGNLNDVTLGGTANTAPNQTASSGSSLMTRDLLPAATGNEASFGPTSAVYTATTNSGIATSRVLFGMAVQTGSSTNGRGCAAFGENFWSNPSFSGVSVPANKAIDFYLHGVTFAPAINTNWVSRIIFGQGNPAARIPPAAGEVAVTNRSWGVEFYYNGTNQVFRPFWHDGTNLTTASEQIMPDTGSTFVGAAKLSQSGTGNLSITLAGSSAARIPDSPTWSTNVPSFNSGNYSGRYILIEAAGNTNQAQTGSGTGILTRSQYIRYVP